MPFGIKNPQSYVSKRTNVVLRSEIIGKCICCDNEGKGLAPIHVNSILYEGIVAALVCPMCYTKHRNIPDWTFEDLQSRKKRGRGRPKTVNTDVPPMRELDLSGFHAECVVRDRIAELRGLATKLSMIANDLELELEHSFELEQSTTHSADQKIVPEPENLQEKIVPEPENLQEKIVPELSNSHEKIVPELLDDDDIEFGMTDEQRARMNAAVAIAKSREGMIVTEKGYENVEDKIKNW